MSKGFPKAKFVLPDVVNPSTSVCFQVQVPNNAMHRAAFRGALGALANWVAWQRDDAHTAKDVADVWRTVVDNIVECPVLQFRNPDPCTLQVSSDGGSTWTTIYSDEECENANPQQPGAQTEPNAGDCTVFRAVMQANNQWYVPFTLEDGDTVEVLSADGIWTDGTTEYCPDGSVYNAGSCSGGATNVSDPLPSVNHMSMILVWPLTGALALPIGSPATIPTSTGPVNAAIQANTALLSSNFGAISFHVRICKTGWTHTFDFRVSNGGFSALSSLGTWVSGQGWTPTNAGGQDELRACLDGFTSTSMRVAEVEFTDHDLYVNDADIVRGFSGNCASLGSRLWGIDPGDGDHASFTNKVYAESFTPASTPCIVLALDVYVGSAAYISKLVLQGTGVDPF